MGARRHRPQRIEGTARRARSLRRIFDGRRDRWLLPTAREHLPTLPATGFTCCCWRARKCICSAGHGGRHGADRPSVTSLSHGRALTPRPYPDTATQRLPAAHAPAVKQAAAALDAMQAPATIWPPVRCTPGSGIVRARPQNAA